MSTENTHHLAKLMADMYAAGLEVAIPCDLQAFQAMSLADIQAAREKAAEYNENPAYIAERKAEAALERWAAACPDNMRETDFADARLCASRSQIDKVLAWQYGTRGLLLTGESGRGKTRSAWHLCRRMAALGMDIRYFTAQEWFSKLQSQVNYGRDDAGEWIKALAKTPLVFIDDMGQEAVSTSKQDWAASWFFQWVDKRMGNGRPTIFTTNLSAQQMSGYAKTSDIRTDPLVRRLVESCEIIKF
jgi:DNA replication protein DnaC